MKKLFSISFLLMCVTMVMAQVPYGRTEVVTMFNDFCPATIQLAAGNVVKTGKANIFLKNSKLVYKDRNNVNMEANMATVKKVIFGNRTFINYENKLAEILDSCGHNMLLRVLLVDVEAMKNDIINNSTITDISGLGSNSNLLGVTRMNPEEDEVGYPLYATYYYVINDKTILCHEREVSRKISKSQREIYHIVTNRSAFSWGSEADLKNLLREMSRY